MKFQTMALGLSACVASVGAQYFSAGWKPGQPASQSDQAPPSIPSFAPQKEEATNPATPPASLADLFDVSKILTSQPAVSLFARMGINITERLVGAMERAKIWDERVQLITDDNFQDLIVDEPLTEQEEKDRTWIIIISVTAGKQDGISKYMDEVFDSAYNETQIAKDLPNVRWGRIDYFSVTAVTTKWAVWQAPYLVILKDRGKTLRFYRPHQLRLRDGVMRAFLKNEDWKVTLPWSTPYAPGGNREYIMDFLAIWLTNIYNAATKIPRWLLFILSGSIASIVINFLHRPKPNRPEHAKRPASTAQPAPTPRSPAQGVPRKRAAARQGKSKK